jgi:predicted restriction endonuclease
VIGCQKPSARLIDKDAIDRARERDRCCLYGLFTGDPCNSSALHVHHIKKRSQSGDDHLSNLITLCPKHHDMAERHQISAEELLDILKEINQYEIYSKAL